jgi:hypothetical protein
MIATLEPLSPLDQWRQRLGGRRRRRAQPRPLAALGYLANGPVFDGLIEVEKLTIVILPSGWPATQAVASPGASASAAPISASSSRIFGFSRSPGVGATVSIWPARSC